MNQTPILTFSYIKQLLHSNGFLNIDFVIQYDTEIHQTQVSARLHEYSEGLH